jgi:hypothetical protein
VLDKKHAIDESSTPPTRRKALAAEKAQAGLAEVARRQRRKRAPVTKLERTLSLRRNQLIRLLDHRGGLHDDDLGRADLRVLLELGLSGPKARKVARWISPAELQCLIDDVDAHPRYWTAGKLSDHFEITFEEKVDPDLGIHHIPCFDRPKHVVDAYYERRRRERNTERKRLHRAVEKKKPKASIRTHDLSPRTRVVLAWLQADEGWSRIEHIVAGVGTMPEFESLARLSMHKAVRRAVHELDKAGFVEVNTARDHYLGRRGGFEYGGFEFTILVVRIRPDDEASEA